MVIKPHRYQGQTVMVRSNSPLLLSLSLDHSPRCFLVQQVIGPAGPLPQAPPKPIVFMEDMTDTELAQAVRWRQRRKYCSITGTES